VPRHRDSIVQPYVLNQYQQIIKWWLHAEAVNSVTLGTSTTMLIALRGCFESDYGLCI